MSKNPTIGPFEHAAPLPKYGDPEILPKGTITRPSHERMPFNRAGGELLPNGPRLPADFLLAPDIKNLPWTRKRGDEWTDAAFRQIVFTFISNYIKTRSWALRWDVRERATSARMSTMRLPPEQEYLVLGFTRGSDKKRFETAAPFPPDRRDAVAARAILDRMAEAIDYLEANG